MRKKTEQMFYTKNDAIGQHLESRFQAIESNVRGLETHVETAYRIADRATRDIERHAQRLTKLEKDEDVILPENFGKIDIKENDERFRFWTDKSSNPKPDALRTACEKITKAYPSLHKGDYEEYQLASIYKLRYDNVMDMLADALAAPEVGEDVLIEDLELDASDMKQFILIDNENNVGAYATLKSVRPDRVISSIACGLSAKQVKAIHEWTGAWLSAQVPKNGGG